MSVTNCTDIAEDLTLHAAGEPAPRVEAHLDDYCTWDLDLKQGPELKLPHIAPAQTLARSNPRGGRRSTRRAR